MTEEQAVSIMAAILVCAGLEGPNAIKTAITFRGMVREEFARTEALATDKQRAAGSAP
jgi:hypothetical protein